MAEELSDKARVALEAMQMGLYVLPLQVTGKSPKIKGGHGSKDASRDLAKHSEWWGEKWPNANIGLRVGHGPTKIGVFDVDNKNGKNGSKVSFAIEAYLGVNLPKAVTVSTPNLGFQYYIQYPPEWEDELLYDDLGEALSLGAGVEIKAKGYVLLPPSHITGDAITVEHPANKGHYVFMNGLALADVIEKLPKLPEAWIKACIKPAPDTKEWDEVRKHRTRNDKGETICERYDLTMAKVFTPPREAIITSDGCRIKHPVHGATNPHNVSIKMDTSEWFCHRHNHGGDALEYYAMCQGIIECGERLRGDAVKQTLKKLRDEGIISEVLADVPKEQKTTVEEMAQYLAKQPKELYVVYRATIDDYHQADWKLKTILWRGSFRISFSWVVSLIHLDTSGPSRSGKTSVIVKFLEFIPNANKEVLFSTSAQALWHMTVKDGKLDPTYYANKILVLLDTPEGALLEVLKAACEEYEETPMERVIATDKAGQVMKFSINGPRMVVLGSVLGVVDSNGQIASRCIQCPTDEQTEKHRTSRAILNTRNDAAGRSIAKDPRTPVIRRAREILDSAIQAASIIEPSNEVRDLMMAISLMLVNDGFNETQKRQFEALCLCGAAENIFERDPEGKTIQIQKEDVLEAWGIINEFFEFASVNLNRQSRAVLNAIPLEGNGKPKFDTNSDHFELAQNHDSLIGANEIADITGIGIKRVYEIVQSRTTGGERIGPLHDNELIQSVKYHFDRRTVYWLTEKGVKAKRAKREVIHVEGDDRTTLYEPQVPKVSPELLTSIPGYSDLFRDFSESQSGRSEGSSRSNLEIREAKNTITISFRRNGNTDTKNFFPEQEVPPQEQAEKKHLEHALQESRTQDSSKVYLSPDNGTEPKKPSDFPDSKPEPAGKPQNERDLEAHVDLEQIIRETILTFPFPAGQKLSREYVLAMIAATIRRRYENIGRELEQEIARLVADDTEIQATLAERTEAESVMQPLLTRIVKAR